MGFTVSTKHLVFNFEENFENVHVNINNSLKMKKLLHAISIPLK